MTRNGRSTLEPVDESWVAHLRDLSSGVAPPTSADPHTMSRVAIRRTRTRRAVITTGGGVMTVAAVAGAAFALNGPAAPSVLLPGGSPSATSTASVDPTSGAASEVPAGWKVHELEGLTYALPPEIARNGDRVQQEPGTLADFWHNKGEDVPPYIRVAYLTPDYEFYDSKAGGLTSSPGDGATTFDLPGSSLASVEEGTPELFAASGANTSADTPAAPVRILIHRADGPGRYMITMTLAEENSNLVEAFIGTLSLD